MLTSHAPLCAKIFLLLVLLPLGAGCDSPGPPTDASSVFSGEPAGETNVAVQLNWYPEAEHGGLYQALADGTYDAAGLSVDVRPGGRATPVGSELELGRVQFAVTNADDVVVFRRQGLDIVALMAVVQNSPRCILVRDDSGVESFDQLSGMTLQRQAGRIFLEFMRSKRILDGVTEVPYHGSISSMVADPKVAIQAYSFAEPLLARQQGVDVRCLMVSDLGWNPYSSVLVTTGKLIRDEPDLVATFVDATRQGWRNYFSDATLGNKAVLSANEHGMTVEALEFGVGEMKPLAITADVKLDQVGAMAPERWETLVEQIESLDPAGGADIDASDCYTLEFIR